MHNRRVVREVLLATVFTLSFLISPYCQKVWYQPPVVPIQISWSPQEGLQVSLNTEVQTPIGKFGFSLPIAEARTKYPSTNLLIVSLKGETYVFDLHGNAFTLELPNNLEGKVTLSYDRKDIYLNIPNPAEFGAIKVIQGQTRPRNMPTQRFQLKLTRRNYTDKDDLHKACACEYGKKADVADWVDLVYLWQLNGNVIVDQLGLQDKRNAMLTYKGQLAFSQWAGTHSMRRQYFIAFNDHDKPDYFLSHEDIDDHLVDLGSWENRDMPVLCRTN